MPDESTNNGIPNAAISSLQQATMSPDVVETSGAGKAFQSVAQSAAIAVQDAADNLRNMSTISSTAIGTALAQYLASGGTADGYKDVIKEAESVLTTAADTFKTIGTNSAYILSAFPYGGVGGSN